MPTRETAGCARRHRSGPVQQGAEHATTGRAASSNFGITTGKGAVFQVEADEPVTTVGIADRGDRHTFNQC